MLEELKIFDLYHITVNRESLDKLMKHFSEIGDVKLGVESNGEISFNIPEESELHITQINILNELAEKIDKIEMKKSKVKTNSQAYEDLEFLKTCISVTIDEILEIYEKKLNLK